MTLLLNLVYLSLAVLVLTMSPLAQTPFMLGVLALCLVPIALLWIWRWLADRSRSRVRCDLLDASPYTRVADRQALSEVFSGVGYPLRDWIMQGYPTGLTQFWVRDAWAAQVDGVEIAAMELQTTPGYMGTGIPLWHVRHGALVVTGTQADDFLSVLGKALELEPHADLFTFAKDDKLVIVWRKHPPDGARLRWLLDRTLDCARPKA